MVRCAHIEHVRYLYGERTPERSTPQTFIITPPVDTEL